MRRHERDLERRRGRGRAGGGLLVSAASAAGHRDAQQQPQCRLHVGPSWLTPATIGRAANDSLSVRYQDPVASARPRRARIEFRVLGPLEVLEDGRALPIERGRQRALLGYLLLRANEVVAQDRLVDALWGESPPPSAVTALHGYVSRLRRLLGAGRLETRPPGYVLRVAPDELDLHRFRELLAQDRHGEALALWRGPALADLAFEDFAQSEIARLEELRLSALEGRFERELADGRHADAVGELAAAVRAHPLRERLAGQLMLALYRSGRQADALAAYRDARTTLVEELGLEPGEELSDLQRRILAHDPALLRGSRARTELPGSLTSFVGRGRELEQV